jgi:VIT1/CCC1 family predicted Fe2+/Mn2+ transporter
MVEQHKRPGLLSDFILGSQDGLVNVLGVILGVAIASNDFTIVLAGGLAATFAESISMGAVAYTTTQARRDHYLAERERERREMRDVPEQEKAEIRHILTRWGFSGKEMESMKDQIVAKPTAMLEIMMSYELNLQPVSEDQARNSALLVGIAAIVGSLIPLVPFVLMQHEILTAIVSSIVICAFVLFFIGWYKAKMTVGSPGRSGLQMALIGTASALAGFAIAYLVGGGAGA